MGQTTRKWTLYEEEVLQDLWCQGWTNADIAVYLDRSKTAVSQHLNKVLNKKRSKENISKCHQKGWEKRKKHTPEIPVERAESLIEPLYDDSRTDVRAEVEIPLMGLLQNSGNLEDILGKIIEEAVYRGVRRALNE